MQHVFFKAAAVFTSSKNKNKKVIWNTVTVKRQIFLLHSHVWTSVLPFVSAVNSVPYALPVADVLCAFSSGKLFGMAQSCFFHTLSVFSLPLQPSCQSEEKYHTGIKKNDLCFL